jgi:hypothetical protein
MQSATPKQKRRGPCNVGVELVMQASRKCTSDYNRCEDGTKDEVWSYPSRQLSFFGERWWRNELRYGVSRRHVKPSCGNEDADSSNMRG